MQPFERRSLERWRQLRLYPRQKCVEQDRLLALPPTIQSGRAHACLPGYFVRPTLTQSLVSSADGKPPGVRLALKRRFEAGRGGEAWGFRDLRIGTAYSRRFGQYDNSSFVF